MTATLRPTDWDGSRATKCDHVRCVKPPVLHVELEAVGTDWGAELDLCEEHADSIGKQTRAFLVGLGLSEPRDEAERNMRAVGGEHLR